MGARKHNTAEKVKESKKALAFAKLNNCPTSPRKMRLVADLVRGEAVEKSLYVLKHSPKEASNKLYKLVLSAVANWQTKNEGQRMEDANLYIKDVFVDSARMMKRIQPAPQGRAHRIRKRSNHVTLTVDSRTIIEETNLDKQI
ncbi:MAG: 50S ribosomal protein L22 [Bacteroidales bacterium]|jgi:large subunit ribosomal protein L22|nr:50S ribosomal protein L22 [Bacteroidales bacterium]